MNLNHMHLSVPDVELARLFYERYFEFKFAFAEDTGKMVFLKNPSGFLLAIHQMKDGEHVEFPAWFHFGFSLDSAQKVKELYERLKQDEVEFERDLKISEKWANFYCWAPGRYRLEVSWDKAE
jgi:lactoylglutathione lyase